METRQAGAAASLINGRYEVVRPIGRGSFAQTMLALDKRAGRQVALKALHPRRAADWKSFDLFDREAAVLRGLDHPGIPAVYEVFRAPFEGSDAAFIAMEFIEGASLAEHIAAQRGLAFDRVTGLLREMLDVLEYLHTRAPPILHRDIKPANIILRPTGAPVLVDFGSVRNILLGAEEDGSTVVGTFGYMPFEQLMGRATPASDLYALGATFLHLVTGRPPSHFLTDDGGHLVVPGSLPGGRVFRDTVARMLRAAPAERFASAREARDALSNVPPERYALKNANIGSGNSVYVDLSGPRVPGRWLDLPAPSSRDRRVIRELVAERTPTTLQLMTDLVTTDGTVTGLEQIAIALISVVTVGVVPAVAWIMSLARRDNLRYYFSRGALVTARIEDVDRESGMVQYVLADGGRGMDTVAPAVASQWEAGMLIQVLVVSVRDGLSIIASHSPTDET